MSDFRGQDRFPQNLRASHRIVPRHLDRDILLGRRVMRANRDSAAPGAEHFADDVSPGQRASKLGEQPGGFGAVGLIGQGRATFAAYRGARRRGCRAGRADDGGARASSSQGLSWVFPRNIDGH